LPEIFSHQFDEVPDRGLQPFVVENAHKMGLVLQKVWTHGWQNCQKSGIEKNQRIPLPTVKNSGVFVFWNV
jgi:hypothetical protein